MYVLFEGLQDDILFISPQNSALGWLCLVLWAKITSIFLQTFPSQHVNCKHPVKSFSPRRGERWRSSLTKAMGRSTASGLLVRKFSNFPNTKQGRMEKVLAKWLRSIYIYLYICILYIRNISIYIYITYQVMFVLQLTLWSGDVVFWNEDVVHVFVALANYLGIIEAKSLELQRKMQRTTRYPGLVGIYKKQPPIASFFFRKTMNGLVRFHPENRHTVDGWNPALVDA